MKKRKRLLILGVGICALVAISGLHLPSESRTVRLPDGSELIFHSVAYGTNGFAVHGERATKSVLALPAEL